VADSVLDGIDQARTAIDSGAAHGKLERLVALTNT
jgi:anthranilate phosphoribosyltransferase